MAAPGAQWRGCRCPNEGKAIVSQECAHASPEVSALSSGHHLCRGRPGACAADGRGDGHQRPRPLPGRAEADQRGRVVHRAGHAPDALLRGLPRLLEQQPL